MDKWVIIHPTRPFATPTCDYCWHCHLCSSIKQFCVYIDSMHKFVFYSSRYLGLNSLPILHIGISFSISIYVAFLIYH